MITKKELGATGEIRQGKTAARRPMHMCIASDNDALRMGKISPRGKRRSLAARIQNSLRPLRLRKIQIRMISCKKLRVIRFFGIEGDIS